MYLLRPEFDKDGDTVFRSVGVIAADRKKWLNWISSHQYGRDAVKDAFGIIHYEWRDPNGKPVADFPSCGDPGGTYSARAVEALRDMLETNGDLHPLLLENEKEIQYFLFDCWSKFEATPNPEFNMFQPTSLKSISINGDAVLPDICIVKPAPGLIVSERFKTVAEAAGLTGMVFSEVEALI